MIIKGKHNTAEVFTDNVDAQTISQIIELCNQEFTIGSSIKIMPDCHKGAGCTIGTTMTIKNKIVPNLVGVDISCGMLVVELGNIDIDLKNFDDYITNNIPSGYNINVLSKCDFKDQINKLLCIRGISKIAKDFNKALGSLGGGNHFIEINVDSQDNKYLVIHSGSRNLGKQVAEYYQGSAYGYHSGFNDDYEAMKIALIKGYKAVGKEHKIQKALKVLQQECKKACSIPKDLCYLEGTLMQEYLHDVAIIQQYASLNRMTMARRIVEECLGLRYRELDSFQTIHNYIDLEHMILRKGAVSAQLGEKLIIPINMRDGSIIAIGKGNPDWNFSAPHGAGRLMSRSQAKKNIDMNDYVLTMKGIYTSSVTESTIDEAPMAYKPIEEIIENTGDTIEIVNIIKPIYNFKSS